MTIILRFAPKPVQPRVALCTACGRSVASHEARGRWIGCARDVVIGRDQHGPERRRRLALLQSRIGRVRPFGIGEGE